MDLKNIMTSMLLKNPSKPGLIALGVGATAIHGGVLYYGLSQMQHFSSQPSQSSVESITSVQKVAALGRLEPEAEVIQLSAPLTLDGDRVLELRVKEGDTVELGQAIAVLDSRHRLQDAMQQAKEQVRIAQAELAQVRSGAKAGEIQAQQAEIARLQAQLDGEIAAQNATIARLQAEVRNAQIQFRELHFWIKPRK